MPNPRMPRTFRADEFFTSADARWLFNRYMNDLHEKKSVHVTRSNDQRIRAGDWQSIEYGPARFRRQGLFDRKDSRTKINIESDGFWLAGAMNQLDTRSTSGTERYWARILHNDKAIAHVGPYTNSQSASARRLNTWGATWGKEGDTLESQMYIKADTDARVISTNQFSPDFWALRLAHLHSPETWTTPITWSGTPIDTQFIEQIYQNFKFLHAPPHCILTEFDSQVSVPTSTWTSARFDTVIADNGSCYSSASDTIITIPRTGIYLVGGIFHFAADQSASGSTYARLQKNSATDIARNGIMAITASENAATRIPVITLVKLTAGDTIRLQGWQDTGGTIQAGVEAYGQPAMFAIFLGVDQAAATWTNPMMWERLDTLDAGDLNTYLRDNLNYLYAPPACKLERTTDQSISRGAWTTITYPGGADSIEVFNTDVMHPSSGRITLNDPGVYLIGGALQINGISLGGDFHRIILNNDDTKVVAMNGGYTNSAFDNYIPILTTMRTKGGDYIVQQALTASGAGTNPVVGSGLTDFWAIKVAA